MKKINKSNGNPAITMRYNVVCCVVVVKEVAYIYNKACIVWCKIISRKPHEHNTQYKHNVAGEMCASAYKLS